jgi:YHS domain-containing protein
MARAIDPVCGMTVDTETAAARSKDANGNTVYFCSVECQRTYEANPERYERVAATEVVRDGDELEKHEPPFTVTDGGFTAPKFGSAGSGGAEYERLPERHNRGDEGESR